MARSNFTITAASAQKSAHASMIGNQTPSRRADDLPSRQLFPYQEPEPRTPAPPSAAAPADELLHKLVEELVDKSVELKDCQVRIIKHISDNESTLADLCPEGTRDQATRLDQFMTVTDPTDGDTVICTARNAKVVNV